MGCRLLTAMILGGCCDLGDRFGYISELFFCLLSRFEAPRAFWEAPWPSGAFSGSGEPFLGVSR